MRIIPLRFPGRIYFHITTYNGEKRINILNKQSSSFDFFKFSRNNSDLIALLWKQQKKKKKENNNPGAKSGITSGEKKENNFYLKIVKLALIA